MLVLIVLSCCAIISHQQLQPDYGRRGLFWLPYFLPSRHINHNQLVHYGYPEDTLSHDSQTLPEILEQPENPFGGVEDRTNHKNKNAMDGTLSNDETDIQLRMNEPDGRLFAFPVDSTFDNPFWKTVTLTITSTMDITSVQPCIPQAQFSVGSSTIACRRKRRAILQDSLDTTEDTQFSIRPSKLLPLMTTSLATIVPLYDNQDVVYGDMITSSKDDLTANNQVTDRQPRLFKEMKFYVKNLASVTAYSYVFNSFVSTKTVSLVVGGVINNVRLICLPDGYRVC